ncbi:MAG: TFIIB-type zinc ribbon-containing protein [Candidatus Binatia bacterium]
MKNETKRPEEMFDEHANEDGYFAAKEHELIEDMRIEFHKNRAERRDAALATCPKCSGKFQKYSLLGCVVERCENCEGIWLNKGELDGILRQQARGPLAIFLDRCFAKTETDNKN